MFIPPFCPYKACTLHHEPKQSGWWKRCGSHHTKCFGPVPRFKCRSCGRTFSTQTFSTQYWVKRIIDYQDLERRLSSSMSIRALSRDLLCSCGTIINRCDRLSRQELAAHAALRPLATRQESVCIDGFQGFDRSQYFPNNITISITSDSRFILSWTHATFRRGGAMKPSQRKRCAVLYPPVAFEKGAVKRSFRELLDELARDRPPLPDRPLIIITDEKTDYVESLSRHSLSRNRDAAHRVEHLRVSSKLPRTILNPLFPSNYLDREIRKDQAAHRRESTCFCRNAANGLSRLTCYFGYHNYVKKYLIKAPMADTRTHAEAALMDRDVIAGVRTRMYANRAFLSRIGIDGLERKLWMKRFPTPGTTKAAYLPDFAYGTRG